MLYLRQEDLVVYSGGFFKSYDFEDLPNNCFVSKFNFIYSEKELVEEVKVSKANTLIMTGSNYSLGSVLKYMENFSA